MIESPFTGLEPHRVYDRLVRLGDEWAERHAAAAMLEDTTKSTLARLTLERLPFVSSKAAAELEALASPEYVAHVDAAVQARSEANKAKVRYDSARVWADLLRTQQATRREEMRLSGMT